jgi:hypothetical protein
MAGCAVCDGLLDDYVNFTSELAPIAHELSEAAHGGDTEEFAAVWEAMTDARARCQRAREALQSHRESDHPFAIERAAMKDLG